MSLQESLDELLFENEDYPLEYTDDTPEEESQSLTSTPLGDCEHCYLTPCTCKFPTPRVKKIMRQCLYCDKSFPAYNKFTRLCNTCKGNERYAYIGNN